MSRSRPMELSNENRDVTLPPERWESLFIPGMDCPDEFVVIRAGLERLAGVQELRPDYLSRTLRVRIHEAHLGRTEIERALAQMGFPTADVPLAAAEERSNRRRWQAMIVSAVLLVLAIGAFLIKLRPVVYVSLAVTSVAMGGRRTVGSAFRALRQGTLDMHVLMTLAVAGAFAIGDWLEAATTMLLFELANWLERRSVARAGAAISDLGQMIPTMAERIRTAGSSPASPDQAGEEVPTETLQVDDVVRVPAHCRIPADGQVVAGESEVDESTITGEGLPRHVAPSSPVYAASLNGGGSLLVRVTTPVAASVVRGVARMVEDARSNPSPTERLVDRFASYYTPAVLMLAVGVALLGPWVATSSPQDTPTDWWYRGLVVLVIACPCAFVIATPLTIACGLRRAATIGSVVKGGVHLENLARAQIIAFDKTGTLTDEGVTVDQVLVVLDADPAAMLAILAGLESHSRHPLAQAVIPYVRSREISAETVEQARQEPGLGMQGLLAGDVVLAGNEKMLRQHGVPIDPAIQAALEDRPALALLHVARDRQHLGTVLFSAHAKPGTAAAMEQLRAWGVQRLVLLTGDRNAPAQELAASAGIQEVYTELLPRDKLAIIEGLARDARCVVMVGDGINDAPALHAATVGIALGQTASDLARDSADVVLLGRGVDGIVDLLQLARLTLRRTWQNIIISLATKAVVLALTLWGLGSMWLAIAADVGTSLLVVANGMRILRDRLS